MTNQSNKQISYTSSPLPRLLSMPFTMLNSTYMYRVVGLLVEYHRRLQLNFDAIEIICFVDQSLIGNCFTVGKE
jgi:hypothetical protein